MKSGPNGGVCGRTTRGIDHTDSYLDGAALRASFGGALPSKTVNIGHERSASFSHLDSNFVSQGGGVREEQSGQSWKAHHRRRFHASPGTREHAAVTVAIRKRMAKACP